MSDARSNNLAARLLRGEPAALARAITRIECAAVDAPDLLRAIYPAIGNARSIGVTGPPGAGKSTLVNGLIHAARRRDYRVGVVAVDPSSPLTGGAILGDRVRMGDHDLDAGVFVRSLASRGERGGLSVAAGRVVDLMDAAGFQRVILETVGAGQSEVDIAELADLRVVVCAPGLGDDIQAIKAGIIEIADILVVNKADLPLAPSTVRDLKSALALRAGRRAHVPVLETSAIAGDGVEALYDTIEGMLAEAEPFAANRSRRRMRRLIAKAASTLAECRVLAATDDIMAGLCDAVHRGDLSLEAAARQFLEEPHNERN